ncbi:MAG: right-handed parallel beta-helix repeat-containing protein [Phycisphaerales bacterium]|nr:right-handed parallel beta-helix repeat-containing protein [Phycisphaerales bacterium]
MNRKTLSFLAVISGTTFPALADTIHVAPCGDDSWTGASPVCAAPDGPKRTIQAGIDASTDGDIVLVADGVYRGSGNRDMDYGGRAITLRGAGGASACIIDCQGSASEPHRAFHFHNEETTASVLEGFTIQNAFEPTDVGFGGAIICETGVVLIQGCIFRGNQTYVGGAIYAGPSELEFVNCDFVDNTATHSGGAIAQDAGGTIVFTNCTFRHNTTTNPAGNGGGGVICASAEASFDRCLFVDNSGARIGGGLWATGSAVSLTDCTFIGNSAPNRASGCALSAGTTAALVNCLFASNTGAPGVGALWVGDGLCCTSSVIMANCTFSRNGTSSGTGVSVTQTSALVASNCIYWDNASPILTEPSTLVWFSHSDIEGGWSGSGSGNMNADPLFADPDAGNFRLSGFSPCIDSGDNTALPAGVTTNLDGYPRFRDDPWTPDTGVPGGAGGSTIVDMGAYERQDPSCTADLNADGLVDFSDYLEFLNLFGADDPRADFNHDGLVDFSDYLEFLNHYDAGC